VGEVRNSVLNSQDASTVVSVVNRLDDRRVLLINLCGEIFRVLDKVPEISAIRPILKTEGTRILLSQSVG